MNTAVFVAIAVLILVAWIVSWIVISLICKFCQPDVNHCDGGVRWQSLAWLTLIPVMISIFVVVLFVWIVFKDE